jgi:CRP-like cAMP-binding protein
MSLSPPEVAQCPIFQELTTPELGQVLELLEDVDFKAGETILREGQSTQYLWIVVRGRVEVDKSAKDGSPRQLAVLEPGSVFGEMSFFRAAPHSASIKALTDGKAMRLSRARYDQLLVQGPSAAHKIAISTTVILADRLRRMDDWMSDMIERNGHSHQREEWREFRSKLYTDWQF